MPIDRDRYSHNLRLHLDNDPPIKGLMEFRKELEREYFSNVTVRNCIAHKEKINLVIELDCPLSLAEMYRHLEDGRWARPQYDPLSGVAISPLDHALCQLQTFNDEEIDIEEFSIFFAECSVIIKKIYSHSIQEQLSDIFEAFAIQLVHLTRNFTEIPYEIYIPVFEEDLFENEVKIARIEQDHNDRKDYVGYWGLYFDSEDDAVIYDLPKKRIITGELYMLNH